MGSVDNQLETRHWHLLRELIPRWTDKGPALKEEEGPGLIRGEKETRALKGERQNHLFERTNVKS